MSSLGNLPCNTTTKQGNNDGKYGNEAGTKRANQRRNNSDSGISCELFPHPSFDISTQKLSTRVNKTLGFAVAAQGARGGADVFVVEDTEQKRSRPG